ncbi:MAG: sigma-70 family RNA polymerase sigma factor [bacterium]|nr:sigma-70 family RNA polymerase sigma factor [bacterium]
MAGSPHDSRSDQELLADLTRRDPMALRVLMDRFDRLVRFTIFRTSRQRCRQDPIWIDSVASEVWTDLCRTARAGKVEDITNIKSFFIQVTRRRCIDALRRSGEVPLGAGDPVGGLEAQTVMSHDDTDSLLDQEEHLTSLRECVSELAEPEQILCGEISAIMAGRWRDAGQRLGMAESTLRSRWARVLQKLRKCLEKRSFASRRGVEPPTPVVEGGQRQMSPPSETDDERSRPTTE